MACLEDFALVKRIPHLSLYSLFQCNKMVVFDKNKSLWDVKVTRKVLWALGYRLVVFEESACTIITVPNKSY